MKNVVIYGRTSMADQNAETQMLAAREYCARMDMSVTAEYVDNGWSGKDPKRPEFERLMAAIRAGEVKCVVVYKLDRIGRSLKHLLNLFEEFKNRGIDFVSITQNINTATPEGRLFWGMLAIFSEFEREMIVARTNAGLARARREGKILGRPKGSKDRKRRRRSGYMNRWMNSSKQSSRREICCQQT